MGAEDLLDRDVVPFAFILMGLIVPRLHHLVSWRWGADHHLILIGGDRDCLHIFLNPTFSFLVIDTLCELSIVHHVDEC
jgi:hypothetical protein